LSSGAVARKLRFLRIPLKPDVRISGRFQFTDARVEPGDLRIAEVKRIESFNRVVLDEVRYNLKRKTREFSDFNYMLE
jgi:hypothetical protein